MNNDTLIVIPIRMASSRLPGKPLIEINGKSYGCSRLGKSNIV